MNDNAGTKSECKRQKKTVRKEVETRRQSSFQTYINVLSV